MIIVVASGKLLTKSPAWGRKEKKMGKKEKITVAKSWTVARNNRVEIVGATYRQALTYLVALRMRYGKRDFLQKPELIYI